jgi:dsRNA-specific ribonuclease
MIYFCREHLKINKMKEFSRNNLTIVFYQKENDQKFSFLIKDEEELTEQLLATVKTKRVKEDKIKYAVNGIFDLIENNLLITKKVNKMEKNPIIELAELVQKQFGANIETRVLGKTGADHIPTVSVEIELPDGRTFEASGTNKRIAKQRAAEKALSEF